MPSIGSNTQHGPGGIAALAAQFLGQDLMIGKALGDQLAEHALDGEVDLGDEIDGALLVDLKVAAELRHLQLAGTDDRLDRGGEKMAGRRATQAWRTSAVRRRVHALDHADFHAAFRRALQLHVVHEVANQEDAAAARFSRFSGASGSATVSGSKPSP